MVRRPFAILSSTCRVRGVSAERVHGSPPGEKLARRLRVVPAAKETGERASGTSGATSRVPKPAKAGATKASSGKIITDARRLTFLLAIDVRTVCPRMLDCIRGARPETQSSRDVPLKATRTR